MHLIKVDHSSLLGSIRLLFPNTVSSRFEERVAEKCLAWNLQEHASLVPHPFVLTNIHTVNESSSGGKFVFTLDHGFFSEITNTDKKWNLDPNSRLPR